MSRNTVIIKLMDKEILYGHYEIYLIYLHFKFKDGIVDFHERKCRFGHLDHDGQFEPQTTFTLPK